jgi:cohesin complex subunit SCC1
LLKSQMTNVRVDNIPVQLYSVIKECIENTGDLVSKRRKLPHTAFAVWKACRFSNLDKCFLEPLIPCKLSVVISSVA